MTGKLFIKDDALAWNSYNVIGVYIFSLLNFVLMFISEWNSYSVSLHNAVLLGCYLLRSKRGAKG